MARPSKPADYGVEAGTVLLGKYRIDAILGHGGMGIVALATHIQLEEKVAIKFLRDDVTLDDETMRRFLREAQNAVKLKSEHVARVSDVGTFDSGVPYMVMEYLEGIDLGQMLQESGKINPSLAVELLLQACIALAEAHSLGIVHRDIKPGNLFVTWRADGSPLLKILDFGISKAPVGNDMNLTQTQSLLGTPAYMSPEQMRSARTVDPRSDIWSLGTVLYEIIQGRRPFEAESFSEMCVKVAVDPPAPLTVTFPSGLDKVILRALEKDQAERYQTIAEMARALAPFARDRNSALVAVERMTRMLGRSRPSFDRGESSPDAIPRGMLRDVKSAPVARAATAAGNLGIGDITDVSIDGEATAITSLDATRTKLTALTETGPDTDTSERPRVKPPDSSSPTIEDDTAWTDLKPWTPRSISAQPSATDRELAAVEPTGPDPHAPANAVAAQKAQAAARMLAVQKAAKPQASNVIPASRQSNTAIPHVGSSVRNVKSAPVPAPPVLPAGKSGPTNAPPSALIHAPLATTLPGLFPVPLSGRGAQPRPTAAQGSPVSARPTATLVDPTTKKKSRKGVLIGALAIGLVLGVVAFAATRPSESAAPTPMVPGPGPGLAPAGHAEIDTPTPGSAAPTTPTPLPTPPVPAVSGSAAGSAADAMRAEAGVGSGATPPPATGTSAHTKAPARPTSRGAGSTKGGGKKSTGTKTDGKAGAKPGATTKVGASGATGTKPGPTTKPVPAATPTPADPFAKRDPSKNTAP